MKIFSFFLARITIAHKKIFHRNKIDSSNNKKVQQNGLTFAKRHHIHEDIRGRPALSHHWWHTTQIFRKIRRHRRGRRHNRPRHGQEPWIRIRKSFCCCYIDCICAWFRSAQIERLKTKKMFIWHFRITKRFLCVFCLSFNLVKPLFWRLKKKASFFN